MKKLILGIVFAVAGTFASQAQEISFEKEIHDFGTFEQHGNGTYEFKFTNTGDAPLIISNSKGSCGCTVPVWPKEPIAPGASNVIKVKYDTKRVGAFNKSVTEDAKKRGTEVIHLNIGQPDIKTPDVALEAIRNFEPNVVAYSHSAGFQSYREGLAKYYKNVGIDVIHTNILVTTGGSEAITMALNSIMDDGDEIIIPEPFYANYNGFSTSAGVTVKPITSSIESGFALPSISEFEKLMKLL